MGNNNKKLIFEIIGVICVIFLVCWYQQYSEEQANIKKQREIEFIAASYDNGVQYIKKENFKDAKDKLHFFKDGSYNNDEKYKDAQVLSIYAEAKYDEYMPGANYRQQYQLAKDELDKIPNNYDGSFATDIKTFKQKVIHRLETYAQSDKDAVKERTNKIYTGDSDAKVIQLWGEPKRKNRTVVGNVVREQWIYGDNNYIYIENGVVTGWQDSQ